MPPPNRDSGARNSASSPALRKTAIDGRWPQRASTKRAATLDSALDRSVRVPPPRLARIAADRRPRPCDPRAPGRSVRRSAARRTARATCLAEEPAAHSTGRSTGGETCGRRRLSRPRGRGPWPGPGHSFMFRRRVGGARQKRQPGIGLVGFNWVGRQSHMHAR